jgi:hypothetical protein
VARVASPTAGNRSNHRPRFVHDRLELAGWQVEITDAQKVKGLAPLAYKTDRIDTSSSAGSLNGRRLSDDVIDAELSLITNGKITGDCVANDSTSSNTFPVPREPELARRQRGGTGRPFAPNRTARA